MSWVIGASPISGGYAVMVSDTQVNFGDGTAAELVRKAYPVGPDLLGGFSGSAEIGFRLIDSIRAYLKPPAGAIAGGAWRPDAVAEGWAPIARKLFESSAKHQQELGSQFLLVGPHPIEDCGIPGYAMPYLARFEHPDFQPKIVAGCNTAQSIGSGEKVEEYRARIREAMGADAGLMKADVGKPGGWAELLGVLVTIVLANAPIAGIGSHLHVQLAARGQFRFGTNYRTIRAQDGLPVHIRMPRVAESWEQFIRMAEELKANAATAVC